MAYGEFYVERQGWARWPKVLMMCRKHGSMEDGSVSVERRRYVPERTCYIVKNSRKYVLSDGRELFDDGCSICNGYVGDGDNYCSNCGARVVDE